MPEGVALLCQRGCILNPNIPGEEEINLERCFYNKLIGNLFMDTRLQIQHLVVIDYNRQ